MSISHYSLQVLRLEDFDIVYEISGILSAVKAWRNDNKTSSSCVACRKIILFHGTNFGICCQKFYFRPCDEYIVRSIAIYTPKIHFLPAALQQKMKKCNVAVRQSFLVLPDPMFWQLSSTLVYETVLNYISKKDGFGRCRLRGQNRGSFHEDFPQAATRLQQLYKKVQSAPLFHCSLSHRTQGKETFYRKAGIAKRAEKTARAMIVPAPHLRPNRVVLPREMAESLNAVGKWVIVNRMPSLAPESFVALFVSETWEHDCIGIPCEILAPLNADFDGDEVNLWPVEGLESQAECDVILNSEHNMRSFNNHLKLFPSQDMLVTFYKYRDRLGIPYESLFTFLRVVYELEGSEVCFDWFDYLRRFYLYATENLFLNAITFEEISNLRDLASRSKDLEEFVHRLRTEPHEEGCLETQVKARAKGDFVHIYMLVGSVGYQPLKCGGGGENFIESSFLSGLSPREYLLHAKAGYEALIESMISIWKPGYNYFKLANNMQNVTVDYRGRIVDGDRVLCCDALQQTYYEDVMSAETFQFLFERHFGS